MSHPFALKINQQPRTYSEDLRLQAAWLHFFLGYTEETAGLLVMSVRSVERYLRKYVRRVKSLERKPEDLLTLLECIHVRSWQ